MGKIKKTLDKTTFICYDYSRDGAMAPYNRRKMMLVTREDVAKHAGVSHGTVSNVVNNIPSVNEEIRNKVLKSIKKLNYIPNQSARRIGIRKKSGRTYNIGCVLFLETYDKFSHPYHSKVLEGIDQEVIRQGYHLFFTYTAKQLDSNLNLFSKVINQSNVDGILTLTSPVASLEKNILRQVRDRIKNIVCLETYMTDIDNIDVDNIQIGYEAVKYLVGLGHKRIGYTGNCLAPMDKRFKGYCIALDDFGLKFDNNIIEKGIDKELTKQGYEQTIKILERAKPVPTAIFAYCDITAIGVIKAIKDKGFRIPEDISVIGVSDIDEAKDTSPPLTTIRIKKKELGIMGIKRLIEKIDNPDIEITKTLIPTELVVRKSCKKI